MILQELLDYAEEISDYKRDEIFSLKHKDIGIIRWALVNTLLKAGYTSFEIRKNYDITLSVVQSAKDKDRDGSALYYEYCRAFRKKLNKIIGEGQ